MGVSVCRPLDSRLCFGDGEAEVVQPFDQGAELAGGVLQALGVCTLHPGPGAQSEGDTLLSPVAAGEDARGPAGLRDGAEEDAVHHGRLDGGLFAQGRVVGLTERPSALGDLQRVAAEQLDVFGELGDDGRRAFGCGAVVGSTEFGAQGECGDEAGDHLQDVELDVKRRIGDQTGGAGVEESGVGQHGGEFLSQDAPVDSIGFG